MRRLITTAYLRSGDRIALSAGIAHFFYDYTSLAGI